MTNQPAKIVLCELEETAIAGLESYSPFCLKVHRALGLADLPYTSHRATRPAQHSDLNPAAQVPILRVGDEVICDSTRILERVDALSVARGGPSLVPRDARARAEAWLWEDFADRALNGYLVAARWADDRNWPRVREAYFGRAPWFVRSFIAPKVRRHVLATLVHRDFLRAGEEALWNDFRRTLDDLESLAPYDGFWVTRDAPSVADLGLFAQLHSLRTPLTELQARELTLRPALSDWLDRVDEATFAGRERGNVIAGLTAQRGRDMNRACPTPTNIHAPA